MITAWIGPVRMHIDLNHQVTDIQTLKLQICHQCNYDHVSCTLIYQLWNNVINWIFATYLGFLHYGIIHQFRLTLLCTALHYFYWYLIVWIFSFSFQKMTSPLPFEEVLGQFKDLYEKNFDGQLSELFISSAERMVLKANSSGEASEE